MLRATSALIAALLLLAAPVLAQEPGADSVAVRDSLGALELPDPVAGEVVEFFNAPATDRYSGPTNIASGDTIPGDVGVLEGPLVLGGHVAGDVVVVNGDAHLLPGASIEGDLWVVGGTVDGASLARIGGEIVVYPERLRYRRQGAGIERTGGGSGGADWGSSDFLVTSGKSYNRVEGMPITFGPRIQTAGSNPLRVHALAIYRTETGFRIHTEDMGYYVRAEQFIGGHRRLRIGATAHSLVDPIEEWHLSDLETGLATFLFHRDFRDHYERRGVSLFTLWEPAGLPLSATGEIRRERHQSRAAGSPWTLFDNAEPWRPQPLVGEGRVSSLVGTLVFDSRNDELNPSHGWYVRGRLEQALSSDLVRPGADVAPPAAAADAIPSSVPAEAFGRFTLGMLDVRRFNRVDPHSRLNFRLLVAGPLSPGPLPPQRQHALGGEGSLPGYELFSRDCGARAQPVHLVAPTAEQPLPPRFYPRYGCDAIGLFQAEYRGKLSFRLRWNSAPWLDDPTDEEGWGVGWDFSPDWTVFLDAGQGWSRGERPDEELVVDVGAGVVVSRLGLYLALPLTGNGGINAFIRLGPRF